LYQSQNALNINYPVINIHSELISLTEHTEDMMFAVEQWKITLFLTNSIRLFYALNLTIVKLVSYYELKVIR